MYSKHILYFFTYRIMLRVLLILTWLILCLFYPVIAGGGGGGYTTTGFSPFDLPTCGHDWAGHDHFLKSGVRQICYFVDFLLCDFL